MATSEVGLQLTGVGRGCHGGCRLINVDFDHENILFFSIRRDMISMLSALSELCSETDHERGCSHSTRLESGYSAVAKREKKC